MNRGTRIRTALAIFTTLNTILAMTDVTQFGNEKLNMWYKIVSVIVNAIVVGINTWYNNDFTVEACEGTGYTRMLKAEANGETFNGVPEEVLNTIGILPEGGDE